MFASSTHASKATDVANQVHQLVSNWQTFDARRILEDALKDEPGHINLRFALGRLLFFEGDYSLALSTLDAVIGDLGDAVPEQIIRFREEVEKTHKTLKPFSEYTTPDGRFLIRYVGRDKALLPYLTQVLQATDKALTEDFKYRPKGRVLVEIYPEIKYLAAVSPLTELDIETSGTIALCKYNRLMFTSPRALVRGYGWRDTVAHEFVHYYVTKLSANTVPIWLHEGIAKFQESRWRAAPGAKLDPPQEDLLARSLKADKLVTFQQMHPSMAKLPSQQAASLAFAEVHTVINFLHGLSGYNGINRLMLALKTGRSMNKSLKSVYGFDLNGLWRDWLRAMKSQGLKTYPGLFQQELEFKRPGDAEKEDDEFEVNYESMDKKKVRDFTHLGELLRGRSRPKAALVEYRKAISIAGQGNPVLQNGAAEALIEMSEFKEVPVVLETVLRYYPRFLRTHLNLGQAFLKLSQPEKAIKAFEDAIGINPFHPLPHAALFKLYSDNNQPELAERERKTLELIR
ncbi:MAG: tetratricopeptide repeat protein [Myxococcota bacterium]|nr:tetratricopeptide repeat protein [Myxococcota bacterium]